MCFRIRHLSELSNIYESRGNRVTVYMFRQVIVPDEGSRGYEYRQHQNIHIYTFYTLDHWAGKDTDLLWARCDDDLLKNMIEKMRAG